MPSDFLLTSSDRTRQLTYPEPRVEHDGLHFEAAEVARRITAGGLESPIRPFADSVAPPQVLDEIRKHCAITFQENDALRGPSVRSLESHLPFAPSFRILQSEVWPTAETGGRVVDARRRHPCRDNFDVKG